MTLAGRALFKNDATGSETPTGAFPVSALRGRFLAEAASGLTLAQCARLLTGLIWLGWADWWFQQPLITGAPLIAVALAAGSLAVMGLAVMVRSPEGQRRLDALLIFGTLIMIALIGLDAGALHGYGTDELAYEQSAAGSLLHGLNPFQIDFTPTLNTFGVFGGATMTLHGTVVPSIAYPALSFLLYVPAVALLGDHSYAGLMVDVAAWAAAGAILWHLMSARVRPWVPILMALPVFFEAIVNGTNDSLFIPFELIAVCCWDRFGDPGERSIARWVGPVALGLACCIKQPPWLIAPFLAIGVGIEAQRRGQLGWRIALRYVAIATAVFLIPNIPFILWNPAAWVTRVLVPLTGGLVPMGIGPAGLLRAYSFGGGNLAMFGLASIAALFAALVLFMRRYPLLKRVIPVLPLAALFVSTRSFTSYFSFCAPTLAVGAATVRGMPAIELIPRLRHVLSAGVVAASVACTVFLSAGMIWPAPAQIQVMSNHTNGIVLTAVVSVDNVSGRSIDPRFILAEGPDYRQAMQISSGPMTLAPNATTILTLTTRVGVLTPRPGDTFQVQIGTTAPDTISSSSPAVVPPDPAHPTPGG